MICIKEVAFKGHFLYFLSEIEKEEDSKYGWAIRPFKEG
jgi:hypothetical protein